MKRILIIDDEQSILQTLSLFFESMNYLPTTVATYEDAISILQKESFHTILTDLKIGHSSGLDILNFVQNQNLLTPVILITAFASSETAIKATKMGIYDYLTKPVNFDQLLVIVERAIERYYLQKEINDLKQQHLHPYIIGKSDGIKDILDLVKRIASTDVNVLITGESGTGKELIARAIHEQSIRKQHPFLPLNCGAIPENLIESELFGHMKGSFTGAVIDRKGIFAAADQGTIFLDEIGELPLHMQPKLLRVLQEHKVKPIGAQHEIKINTRTIAATNKNLLEEVQQNRFRQDLFYRLNVITIPLPPLRKRRSDIPLLVTHFIEKFNHKLNKKISGVTNEVMDYFFQHPFPGNIRELENMIERMATLEQNGILTTRHLPPKEQTSSNIEITTTSPLIPPRINPENGIELDEILERVERYFIDEALELSGGVKKEAAKLLNLSFRSFRYRLKKLNIE